MKFEVASLYRHFQNFFRTFVVCEADRLKENAENIDYNCNTFLMYYQFLQNKSKTYFKKPARASGFFGSCFTCREEKRKNPARETRVEKTGCSISQGWSVYALPYIFVDGKIPGGRVTNDITVFWFGNHRLFIERCRQRLKADRLEKRVR